MAQLAPLVGGGWKHWFDHAPRHRDHFLTQARPDGTADCRSLSCVEYAGLSRGIVADLLDADGEALVTGVAPIGGPPVGASQLGEKCALEQASKHLPERGRPQRRSEPLDQSVNRASWGGGDYAAVVEPDGARGKRVVAGG